MKGLRFFSVFVLVALIALFGAKSIAWAGPAHGGTVENPGGSDSGDCGGNLVVGGATGFTGMSGEDCTSKLMVAGGHGEPYPNLDQLGRAVYIEASNPNVRVTVCFAVPQRYIDAGASIYRWDGNVPAWFTAPWFINAAGNMCAYWWGSATFAVFYP